MTTEHSRIARKFLQALTSDTPSGRQARKDVVTTAARVAPFPADDADLADLADELREHIQKLNDSIVTTGGEVCDTFVWDHTFAIYAASLGETGKKLAVDVRKASKDLWVKAIEKGDPTDENLWYFWVPPDAKPAECPFACALTIVLWFDIVKPRREARRHQIIAVEVNGGQWAKVQKSTGGLSWAFGAPGKVIEVDGDLYTAQPALVRIVPRSWSLLPADHETRPHQTSFALETEARPEVASNKFVISPYAAKLALVLLATEGLMKGGCHAVELGVLTRWTRPEAKRLQACDYQATVEALTELSRLCLGLPTGPVVRLFDLPVHLAPEGARPNLVLYWGLSRPFLAAFTGGTKRLLGKEYNGEFLLNLSGALRLPTHEPALLRSYLRAAGHWNAARVQGVFDTSRIPTYSLDQWGALMNALPSSAVEYLIAKGDRQGLTSTRRANLSKARKTIQTQLDALAEEYGLIRLEGSRDQLRLLPPEGYTEAWHLARKGHSRPVDPPRLGSRSTSFPRP